MRQGTMSGIDPLQPQRCSSLLAALAAPERLNIVRLLATAPQNVTQITEALGIPPLNVSHHLSVLKNANLIKGEKQGRFVVYALCDGVLSQVVEAGVVKEAINLGCCCVTLQHIDGAKTDPPNSTLQPESMQYRDKES